MQFRFAELCSYAMHAQKLLQDQAKNDFVALKKRSIEDIDRSGGLFGETELAALTKREAGSDSEEEELMLMKQVLEARAAGKSMSAVSDVQAQLVDEKKRRLLEEYS